VIISTDKLYNGSAGFYTTTPFDPCGGGTEMGGCCYQTAAAALDAGANFPPADVNAGSVTLQNGATTIATLPFTAGTGYSSISSISQSGFGWDAGDSLGVTATGDGSGVAAFTGNVTAPARLGSVHPAISTLTTIPRSSDFVLTWTAAGTGTVTFNIIAAQGTTPDGLIRCTAPSSGGTLTVPAALLGMLQSGDQASVSLTVADTTTINAANATVGLSAEVVVNGSASLP
jgi:hypothetical protein